MHETSTPTTTRPPPLRLLPLPPSVPARCGTAFVALADGARCGRPAAAWHLGGQAAFAGWRTAALGAGVLASGALATVMLLRGTLAGPGPASAGEAADGAPGSSPFAFLRVGAIWMGFFFFLASTLGFGALQNFGPSVLKNIYGLALTAAASALSLYLLGGAAGISIGGFLAARYQAHERVVAGLRVPAAPRALAPPRRR